MKSFRYAELASGTRQALLVVLSAALLIGLSLTSIAWLRVPAALAWLLFVPGWPWASRLRLADRGDAMIAAVAISMALAASIGGAMAVLHIWSTIGAVLVLTALAVTGAILPTRRREQPSAPTPPTSGVSP